jgi:hypothetical protein
MRDQRLPRSVTNATAATTTQHLTGSRSSGRYSFMKLRRFPVASACRRSRRASSVSSALARLCAPTSHSPRPNSTSISAVDSAKPLACWAHPSSAFTPSSSPYHPAPDGGAASTAEPGGLTPVSTSVAISSCHVIVAAAAISPIASCVGSPVPCKEFGKREGGGVGEWGVETETKWRDETFTDAPRDALT